MKSKSWHLQQFTFWILAAIESRKRCEEYLASAAESLYSKAEYLAWAKEAREHMRSCALNAMQDRRALV